MSDDREAEIWNELLKHLRGSVPGRKVKFTKGGFRSTLVVGATEVEIRLDRERCGSPHLGRHVGRFYFTIGEWRRNVTRQRAVEKQVGFDWPKIVQIVENECARIENGLARTKQNERARLAAEAQLRAFCKRRRSLKTLGESVRVEYGKFAIDLRDLDIDAVEKVLDALHEMGVRQAANESDEATS